MRPGAYLDSKFPLCAVIEGGDWHTTGGKGSTGSTASLLVVSTMKIKMPIGNLNA